LKSFWSAGVLGTISEYFHAHCHFIEVHGTHVKVERPQKKAVKGYGMTHSTTNKLEVGSETLTDREYDLY